MKIDVDEPIFEIDSFGYAVPPGYLEGVELYVSKNEDGEVVGRLSLRQLAQICWTACAAMKGNQKNQLKVSATFLAEVGEKIGVVELSKGEETH